MKGFEMPVRKRLPKDGTQYGGHPGFVQPPPHNPQDVADEMARGAYLTDPDDPEDTPEAAIQREVNRAAGG